MLVMLQFEESEDTKAWLTKNNFPRQMRAIWNCRHYRTSIFRHNVFFPRTPPEANMAWSREAPWPLILRNSFSVASDIFCTPVELSRPPRPLKIYARPLKISFTTETLSIYLGMDGAIVFIGLRIATPMSFVRAITRESRDAIKQCDSKPRRREYSKHRLLGHKSSLFISTYYSEIQQIHWVLGHKVLLLELA